MRSRRSPHALVIALAMTVAARGAAGQGAGSGSAPAAPALPSSNEIPEWTAGPAKFAVTPFENYVPNGKSMEWIVAEAPFEIAEKTEAVLGLDPVGAPLYVPGEQ